MSIDNKAPTNGADTKTAARPPNPRQATINKFENSVLVVRVYSGICAILTAVFLALYSGQVVAAPALDIGDRFAEVGSTEFILMAFFALMHTVVVVLLYRPITAPRAAVGLALSVCASLVYILLYMAVHLSNILEMQMPGGDDEPQGPPRPAEGSGLAMADDYFTALKVQEEAASAGVHRGGGFEPGSGIAFGELFLMVLSAMWDIFTVLLDPKKRAKGYTGPDQAHSPLFYVARPELLLISFIGLIFGLVTVFRVEGYVQATSPPPQRKSAMARNSGLTAAALAQHVQSQDAKAQATPAAAAVVPDNGRSVESKKKQ